MNNPLQVLRDEFAAATARLRELVDPIDDATWRRRPGEGRWSVAECIEHLNLTSRAMLPPLQAAIAGARARGLTTKHPRLRRDLAGWLLCRTLEPRRAERRRRRIRLKTTEPFVPASIESRPVVMAEWGKLQAAFVTLTREAEGVDLTKLRIASPFNAKVHYNAYSALRVVLAHQRRHLLQAQETLDAISRQHR